MLLNVTQWERNRDDLHFCNNFVIFTIYTACNINYRGDGDGVQSHTDSQRRGGPF